MAGAVLSTFVISLNPTIHPQIDDVTPLKGSKSQELRDAPQDTQLETSSWDLSSARETCVISAFHRPSGYLFASQVIQQSLCLLKRKETTFG